VVPWIEGVAGDRAEATDPGRTAAPVASITARRVGRRLFGPMLLKIGLEDKPT
jgi:hypothetical protein